MCILKKNTNSLIFLLFFFLVSCTIGPNYIAKQMPSPPKWKSSKKIPIVPQKKIRAAWWKSFNDPILNRLIKQALVNNLDLKTAKARVLKARANHFNAFANLFPDLDGDFVAARLNPGFLTSNKTFNIAQGTFDASWELDIFGGKRRRLEAENDFALSSIEDYKAVRLTLIAEIASTYFDLRLSQQQLQLLQKNIKASNDNYQLTRSLKKSGISNELDLSLAKSQFDQFKSKIPAQQIAINSAKNSLTTLLGLFPGELDSIIATSQPKIPHFNEAVLLTEPAQVIRQRPDVRMAERRLAGQTALIGEALAKLFPDLSIGGFVGKQSTNLLPNSTIFGIGPNLYLPLLRFGKIQSQINLARANEREAFFSYKQTILKAIEDVENQILAYNNSKLQEYYLHQTTKSTQLALHFAVERYKKGLSNFINVTESEISLYNAQLAELKARSDTSKHLVALYKGLGIYPSCHL